MKIQKRLLITILPVVFITVAAVVFTSMYFSSKTLEQQGIDNAQLFSESYSVQLNGKANLVKKVSQELASAVVTAINIETALIDINNRYPEFENIFYVSQSGKVKDMAPYDSSLIKEDFTKYSWWNLALMTQTPQISDPVKYRGELVLLSFCPVLYHYLSNRQPEVIGMVVVVINIDTFFEGFDEFKYGETGTIFVTNSDGCFVYIKQKEYIMKSRVRDLYSTTDLTEVEKAMVEMKSGIATYYNGNEKNFISFNPVPNLNWSLGIIGSHKEFSKPIRILYLINTIILAIGLTIALLVIFLIVRSVVRPIVQLTSMAEKINRGEMDLRSDIKSKNEMGVLSKAINKMLGRLSNYNKQLEADVIERTKELQAANEELLTMNESIEAMNEELLSTNESIERKNREMEAMNEELVSTNESLDKNSREVEAMNEELTATVEQLDITNRELEITKDALWAEMKLAKKLQTVLLPAEPKIPGLDISAFMKTADQVGGDYYDVINVDGRNWFLIGDVSGHGVTAGLIMMMVQTAIHIALSQNPNSEPEELLRIINKTIHRNISMLGGNRYITLTVFAYIDEGKISYAGAHLPALLYRKKTNSIEVIETPGVWIGLVHDIEEMNKNYQFSMSDGDALLLYTDGISEALTGTGEQFSQNALSELFKSCAHMGADKICNIIKDYSELLEVDDDITALVLKKVEV